MKKIDKDYFNEDDFDEEYFDDIYACSSTECTGLIPAMPRDSSEIEAYESLYHYLPKTHFEDFND